MNTKKVLAIVAVVALAAILYAAGPRIAPLMGLALDQVAALGAWAPLVFVLLYAAATVGFVPGSLLTLAGGLLFGLFWGTVWVFLGANLGASAAFLIARFLARGQVEKRLAGNEAFARIDKAVGKEGLKIAFLLRLVPFFPFIWLNYGLGLTGIRFRDYLLASFGMLPGTFLYVYYGKAIGSLAALSGGAKVERGSEQWVFLALGLVAAIAVTTLITRIASKALRQATEPGEEENDV